MPRAPLMVIMVGALLLPATRLAGQDPHLDPSLVPGSCAACHVGHGVPQSPMLPESQLDVCLSCHGSSSAIARKVNEGLVSPNARPVLISQALAQPSTHFMSRDAFSDEQPGAVTCSSCHSPHRGMRGNSPSSFPTGQPLRSTKDPARFEFELCQTCHGNRGPAAQSLLDISWLLNPANASYHPVESPAFTSSPSVIPELAGRQINCTDCHGNADPGGPRGPHGSTVPFLLKRNYTTVDGAQESADAYALCYTCHDRETVLSSVTFPEHRDHIVKERASCATCHNPHGSVRNLALIRFGEETLLGGVSPSAESGRLAFVSDGPGSGACYLSCHGRDHAPETYGTMDVIVKTDPDLLRVGPRTPGTEGFTSTPADGEPFGNRRPGEGERRQKRER